MSDAPKIMFRSIKYDKMSKRARPMYSQSPPDGPHDTYHHADAVNALVEAATRAQHLLDGGPATGQDASKWTNELRAAIAAIKRPAE